MSDPGWDDTGMSGGDGWDDSSAAPAGSGSGGQGPGGSGSGGSRSVWQQPRIMAGAGGVLLVIIVVLAVVLANRNSSTPTADHSATTPTPTSGSSSPSSSVPASTTPSQKPTTITLRDFTTQADAVCTAYKPKLAKATAEFQKSQNYNVVVPLFAAELAELKKVPLPTQNPDLVSKWLSDASDSLADFQAHNLDAFDSSILVADEYAGKLGMHVCNYGH